MNPLSAIKSPAASRTLRSALPAPTRTFLSVALLLATLLALFPAGPAQAQQSRIPRSVQSLTDLPLLRDQLPVVYEFVRTGQPSIRVLVVGSVSNQGFYYVKPGTDIEDIILYSGGPSALGELRRPDVLVRDQIRPEVRFTISRKQPDGNRRIVQQVQLSEIIAGRMDKLVLLNDDILLVETEQPNPPLYRDVLSFIQLVTGILSSSVVLLYLFGVIERRYI